MDRPPPACPPWGIEPATQACALSGNRTSDLLVHRLTLNHWATSAQLNALFCLFVCLGPWFSNLPNAATLSYSSSCCVVTPNHRIIFVATSSLSCCHCYESSCKYLTGRMYFHCYKWNIIKAQ
uniref:Uncharacterized protein n=1 Tax=Myotis myotis TaxID=51298 RepID=A0A7J7RUQ4_MYOMY|nr:hypothetical protein mMyoMyo1_010127 [Myotis myotis]